MSMWHHGWNNAPRNIARAVLAVDRIGGDLLIVPWHWQIDRKLEGMEINGSEAGSHGIPRHARHRPEDQPQPLRMQDTRLHDRELLMHKGMREIIDEALAARLETFRDACQRPRVLIVVEHVEDGIHDDDVETVLWQLQQIHFLEPDPCKLGVGAAFVDR